MAKRSRRRPELVNPYAAVSEVADGSPRVAAAAGAVVLGAAGLAVLGAGSASAGEFGWPIGGFGDVGFDDDGPDLSGLPRADPSSFGGGLGPGDTISFSGSLNLPEPPGPADPVASWSDLE